MSIDYRGNPWDVSGVGTGWMYDDSCVNTPSRCEASCAAFDSTFPTTPAGYSIANPSGTTASGLGVRRCADGYCGVAEVTCGGGGAFEAPSGCAECPGSRQTVAITDANIATAVEECQAESATFDCPASQATYGPIEDWDVGAVTSLNTWGNGCMIESEGMCGRASPNRFDLAALCLF